MDDMPFATYLEALTGKPGVEPGGKKKRNKDLGGDIVKFMDFYDEMARMALVPLTAEEKSLIQRLVQESMAGPAPTEKDNKAINKLLMHLMMAADEEGDDSAMPVFLLGMAYERMRKKLTLLPAQT